MSKKQNCESEVRYKQKSVIEFLCVKVRNQRRFYERLKVVYGKDVFDVRFVI